MKPFLRAESTIRVGDEAVIESDSPDCKRGVVFEDDGETGYFYARDFSRPELFFVDALLVYDVAAVVNPERPSEVRIIWSREFMAAALLINQRPHVIYHFGECCGYVSGHFRKSIPSRDGRTRFSTQVSKDFSTPRNNRWRTPKLGFSDSLKPIGC
jgi:hypothetical protein